MLERKRQQDGYCGSNDEGCEGYSKEGDCKGCSAFIPKKDLEENKMKEVVEEKQEIDGSTITGDDTTTFVNKINLPEENGAKNHETDSPNFHRHHGKLSKKIQDLCEEVGKLKENNRIYEASIDFLMSLIPTDAFEKAVKNYFKRQEQKDRVNREIEKLRECEKNLVKMNGVDFVY